MINKWPLEQEGGSTRDRRYYSFAFHEAMPKLNTNNPEVVNYLTNICIYWVKEYGVDGLRFDVGNEVSHSFIRSLRSKMKALKPDLYLLGEIWHDGRMAGRYTV